MTRLAVVIPETVIPGDVLVIEGAFEPADAAQIPGMQPLPAYDAVLGVWSTRAGPGSFLDRAFVDPAFGVTPGGAAFDGPAFEQASFEPRPVRFIALSGVYGFGPYTVAVKVRDRHGQQGAGSVAEFTFTFVGKPLGVNRITYTSYDAPSDRVTFGVSHLTMLES